MDCPSDGQPLYLEDGTTRATAASHSTDSTASQRSSGSSEREQSYPPAGNYLIQVGAFSSRTNADEVFLRVVKEYRNVYINDVESGGTTLYKVQVGPFQSRSEAEAELPVFRDALPEFADAYVVTR